MIGGEQWHQGAERPKYISLRFKYADALELIIYIRIGFDTASRFVDWLCCAKL